MKFNTYTPEIKTWMPKWVATFERRYLLHFQGVKVPNASLRLTTFIVAETSKLPRWITGQAKNHHLTIGADEKHYISTLSHLNHHCFLLEGFPNYINLGPGRRPLSSRILVVSLWGFRFWGAHFGSEDTWATRRKKIESWLVNRDPDPYDAKNHPSPHITG